MHYREAMAILDNGGQFSVMCPDGLRRKLWGYNGTTGDLFVAGWLGDVWMNCSDGTLRAEFEHVEVA